MEPLDSIEKMVKRAGFELDKKVHMKNITGDENQFLCFFKKLPSPNSRIEQLKKNIADKPGRSKNVLNHINDTKNAMHNAREQRKIVREKIETADKEEEEKKKRINRKLGIFK